MKRFLPFLLAPLAAVAADYPTVGSIERKDAAILDLLIPPNAQIEKVCEGFNWSEGPVWKDGTLLFSDVPENVVYGWKPGETKAAVFLNRSGMTTPTAGFREQGSNGLAVDAQGHVVLCQHGDRRIARLVGEGKFETVADRFEGKRFSSPNDLAIRRNGDIYFTDPPYGLEGLNKSPIKEMPFNGVYRVDAAGKVTLLTKEIGFPNGIAFSPDEKTLYVADSGEAKIHAFDVQDDGSIAGQRLFFDAAPLKAADRKGSCDGLKVDARGNLFATGPGGVLIINQQGRHLGTILTGEATANCAWGDGGDVLYMTADMFICRVRTSTKGAGF